MWAPAAFWHPFGFFITTMAVTAIIISADDGEDYHYDQGTYYEETTDENGQKGYQAVPAPIGATVPTLVDGTVEVTLKDKKYYYYAGAFYFPAADGEQYTVVAAPVGAVIPYLPDGYKKEYHGDILYYAYGGIYYQPQSTSGEVSYAVVAHP